MAHTVLTRRPIGDETRPRISTGESIMELYIPKGGNTFSICIQKGYRSISIGRIFRYSTVAGVWFRRPRIEPKMTALKRFEGLVKLDQIHSVSCQKCIKYPIDFYSSIRGGKELEYSGYENTIIDKLLRRN